MSTDPVMLVSKIVETLKKPPFNKRLSLVTFDQLSASELVGLLNDVLIYLDEKQHSVDLLEEDEERRGQRIAQFLSLMKYPSLPRDLDTFQKGVASGKQDIVYPVLNWLLTELDKLKKRAYLAHFLIPIDVPQEFFQAPEVKDTHAAYKALQKRFTAQHKKVEKFRENKRAPSELRKEIQQLEIERGQLKEKIAKLRSVTENINGFSQMLKVTSEYRQEQEIEVKLTERIHEQQHLLKLEEQQYGNVQRLLMTMERKYEQGAKLSAEETLKRLQVETKELQVALKQSMPQQFMARKERLGQLQDEMMKAPKTQDDIRQLESRCSQLEREVEELTARNKEAAEEKENDKLGIYRTQVRMVTRKLTEAQFELEEEQAEAADLNTQINDKEAILSELTGPKFMKRDQFREYANELRTKTKKYKTLKAELAAVERESVILSRTEQILKSQADNVQELLDKLEAKAGIQGHSKTLDKLEAVSQQKKDIDSVKADTLEEISKIVTDLNVAIKTRKNKLAPQIKELRSVRQKFQELEHTYLQNKSGYDNVAVGLESERLKLEAECESRQNDCVREESRFHYYHAMVTIAEVRKQKAKDEKEYTEGPNRYLPDFKTYSEVYDQKIKRQKTQSKQLRQQRSEIEASAGDHIKQKRMFENLKDLMAAKKKSVQKTKAKASAVDTFDNVNGSNVLTIE
jgi:intraflagellar transport protein 81